MTTPKVSERDYKLSPNERKLLAPIGISYIVHQFQINSRKGWDKFKCVAKMRIPTIQAAMEESLELGEAAKNKSRMLIRGLLKIYTLSFRPSAAPKDFFFKPPTGSSILNRAKRPLSQKATKVCGILNAVKYQVCEPIANWIIQNESLDYWQSIALSQVQTKVFHLNTDVDYRDRYYIMGRLSPQSEKSMRCCIQFAERYEMTKPEAQLWLNDLNDDFELTTDNAQSIWNDRDNLTDQPMKVAAAYHLLDWLSTGKTNFMHYRDATGSAIQITGALMRDEQMCYHSNVIPSLTKRDPYGAIIQPDDPAYKAWQRILNKKAIRKHLIKGTCMPHGYGAGDRTSAHHMFGYKGCQSWDDMWKSYASKPDSVNFSYPIPMIKKMLFKPNTPDLVWNHLLDVAETVKDWSTATYPAQVDYIDLIRDAALGYYDAGGIPFKVNILDLVVSSLGLKSSKDKVKVNTNKSGIHAAISLYDLEVNDGSSAAMAAIIHALDALILSLAIIDLHSQGITSLSAIHDAMAMRACDITKVCKAYAKAFHKVMSHFSINTFLLQLGAEQIELGNLDIRCIIEAILLHP